MHTSKILEWLSYAGMIVVFAGLIMYLNDINQAIYIYSAGVLPILAHRFHNVAVSDNENRRKHIILAMSSLLLASAAVGMFLNQSWWIVPIAIAAAFDLYISFRRF